MDGEEQKILIRGLEVSACHGVHGFEKKTPQRFVFDADVYTNFYSAAKSDDLSGTISYSDICSFLAELARKHTFNLIEKLAYEGVYGILDAFPACKVKLTVFKPEAPLKHKFSTVGVTFEAARERAFLSLGSSVGDKKNYLDEAIKKLNATRGISVEKVSSYISTEPYGGVAKNQFLNCAAEVITYLPPRALLEEIHRIEAECGRVREKRWDDRTLDIDIIFYGGKIVCESDLQIPHPEYFKRDFVLKPLCEIAPDFICPLKNVRVKEL